MPDVGKETGGNMHKSYKVGATIVGAFAVAGSLGSLGQLGASVSDASGPTPAFAATAAERLFPSGTPAVVIVPGASQAGGADYIAGQALASRLGGALLVSKNPAELGPATATALEQMTVPQVNPNSSYEPQPYQPQAGKAAVYLVGGIGSFSSALVNGLMGQGYQVHVITAPTQSALLAKVQAMVAPAMPSAATRAAFPSTWTAYAGGQDHNSAFSAPAGSPSWVTRGVSWNFPEMAAVPFSQGYADVQQLGARSAPVKMTQNLGNAVGVSAVGGVIYAESDDFHLYALSAHTGALLWESPTLVNAAMGNPVVANGMIYVTVGDTGFPFSELLKYYMHGGNFALRRGLMYSAIYAFNQSTGRMVWRQDFAGEAMASPVVVGANVYEPTGGGNLWAFNGATGAVVFKSQLGGFDSMSSANTWTATSGQTEILAGTSDQNNVVAVDAATGNVLWKQPTALSIFNTGMGDNSPAVDQSKGLVFQDSVTNFNAKAGTVDLSVYAMDAATGKVVWSADLGTGPVPPAYKAGVITVHGGLVYVGDPVTSTLFALDETTGAMRWSFAFQNAGPAGAGRGNPVVYGGVLWVASGPTIYAIDPQTGRELSSYTPGGRFGIVNPVIVGGTMYLGNSYDWVQAIALSTIYPGFKA